MFAEPDTPSYSPTAQAGAPSSPSRTRVAATDRTLTNYFAAWNETDAGERQRLLRESLSEGAELVDPLGRWRGTDGVSERIARYHATAPDTKVVPSSGVDSHNDVERYAWRIVDAAGSELMEGLDVAERDATGRLQRITMFHGSLPAVE